MKTITKVTLTEKEKEVLIAIINSDYQESRENPVNHQVWYLTQDDVDSNIIKKEQLSGVISSCVKKGFVEVVQDGNDSTIEITQLGFDTYNNN